MSSPVVVLAGGTGGAKLARGMLDVVGAENLVVIANTGDDVEIYGGYVSPDPDLVTFWLADQIDERGWGLAGDTFSVMQALGDLGQEVWFNLGDRDLAIALERARRLSEGERLTAIQQDLAARLGVGAAVLPMADTPVRTRVLARGQWWAFQEFMISGRGQGPVQGVDYRGAAGAAATPEILDALQRAQAIVIGPSNPVISIAPILAVPGIHEAMRESAAPVVAVSPFVGGEVIKGPTEGFMDWAGQPRTSAGIAALYAGLIDGLLADDKTELVPVRLTDVLMSDAPARARVADEALRFALSRGR